MSKQKRTKTRRPHGVLIRHLVNVILAWEREEFADLIKCSTKTVDDILRSDENGNYSMRADTYKALVKAINDGLSKKAKTALNPEQFLIDYKGPYPADLCVAMAIGVAAAPPPGEVHDSSPPVSALSGPKSYPITFLSMEESYKQFSTALADVGPTEKTVIAFSATTSRGPRNISASSCSTGRTCST